MHNEPIDNDEFEYNDGLGDMLREKEKPVFSWAKTGIFLFIVILVVIIFFFLSFSLGKKILQKKNSNPYISQITQSPLKTRIITILKKLKLTKKSPALTTKSPTPSMDVISSDQGVTVTGNTPSSAPTLVPTAQPSATIATLSVQGTTNITATPASVIAAKPVAINPPPATPVLAKPAPAPALSSSPRPYKVLAGSFSTKANALVFIQELKNKGLKDPFILLEKTDKKEMYKVQVGAFKTYIDAKRHIKDLSKKNIPAFVAQK